MVRALYLVNFSGGVGGSGGGSLCKETPFMRALPSGAHYFPKLHLLTPSPWGLGFHHGNSRELGVGTQTFRSQHLARMNYVSWNFLSSLSVVRMGHKEVLASFWRPCSQLGIQDG